MEELVQQAPPRRSIMRTAEGRTSSGVGKYAAGEVAAGDDAALGGGAQCRERRHKPRVRPALERRQALRPRGGLPALHSVLRGLHDRTGHSSPSGKRMSGVFDAAESGAARLLVTITMKAGAFAGHHPVMPCRGNCIISAANFTIIPQPPPPFEFSTQTTTSTSVLSASRDVVTQSNHSNKLRLDYLSEY